MASDASGARSATTSEDAALRREHDRLAERLASRRSIDLVRIGCYGAFSGLIAAGLSFKLGWDRWFSTLSLKRPGPPVFFFVATAVTLVLLAVALVAFTRARRHMRQEDALFARLRELRAILELDP